MGIPYLCPYEVFSEPGSPDSSLFLLIFLRRLPGFTLLMAFPQAGREGTWTSQESSFHRGKEVSPEHAPTCLPHRDKPGLDLTTALLMNFMSTVGGYDKLGLVWAEYQIPHEPVVRNPVLVLVSQVTPICTTVVTPFSYSHSPDKFLPDPGGIMRGGRPKGRHSRGHLLIQSYIRNLYWLG